MVRLRERERARRELVRLREGQCQREVVRLRGQRGGVKTLAANNDKK